MVMMNVQKLSILQHAKTKTKDQLLLAVNVWPVMLQDAHPAGAMEIAQDARKTAINQMETETHAFNAKSTTASNATKPTNVPSANSAITEVDRAASKEVDLSGNSIYLYN